MRVIAAALLSLFLVAGAEAGMKTTHSIGGLEWRELTIAENIAGLMVAKAFLPPARFDYFNPNVRIMRMSDKEVSEYCGKYVPSPIPPIACARRSPDKPCLIVVPLKSVYLAGLFRHEMAHCNGWPPNHPP